MLSRVADSIYWMQRYRERAENIARLIDVNLFLSIDAPGDDQQQWQPIVVTTGDYSLFKKIYGKPTEKNIIEFLTFDQRNPNSILNCLFHARENARSVREAITLDMWHVLNTLYLFMRKTADSPRKKIKSLYEFYSHIRKSCQLFTGIMDTTLSHDEGWHFGRLGNLLERADQSSRILDVEYYILLPSAEQVGTSHDDVLWSGLLRSVSGLEMYRRLWHEIHHSHVIDFIVLNREFPRAIHSCLFRAKESLQVIGFDPSENRAESPIEMVEKLCAELESLTVYDIVKIGLHEFLGQLQSKISHVSNGIYTAYFAPFPTPVNGGREEIVTTGVQGGTE